MIKKIGFVHTGVAIADTAVPNTAVDGYLVFSVPSEHPALETILSRDAPVVIVDEPDLGDAASFVGINDRLGARMAADHLLGHDPLPASNLEPWINPNWQTCQR